MMQAGFLKVISDRKKTTITAETRRRRVRHINLSISFSLCLFASAVKIVFAVALMHKKQNQGGRSERHIYGS